MSRATAPHEPGDAGRVEPLHLSVRRYRALMEQSPLSTQVFAPDGRALAANHAWERLWGTTRDQLAGYNVRHDRQLVAKGIMPYVERAFAGEAVEIPPVVYDPAETGRPGRPRWVRAHMYPVKDDAGAILEVVLVLEDVTAETEAQQALRLGLGARRSVRRRALPVSRRSPPPCPRR